MTTSSPTEISHAVSVVSNIATLVTENIITAINQSSPSLSPESQNDERQQQPQHQQQQQINMQQEKQNDIFLITNNKTHNDQQALNRSANRKPLPWPTLQSIILSPDPNELSRLARSEEQQRIYRKCRADIQNEWESIYDYLLCTKFGFDWDWSEADAEKDRDNEEGVAGAVEKRKKKRSKPSFDEWQAPFLDAGSTQSTSNPTDSSFDPQNDSESSIIVLSVNDFPYYFSPGIDHWVLWKLGGQLTKDEIARAKLDILQSHRGKCGDDTSNIDDGSSNIYNLSRKSNSDEFFENSIGAFDDASIFLHWINPPHLKSLPGIDHVHILFHRAELSHL